MTQYFKFRKQALREKTRIEYQDKDKSLDNLFQSSEIYELRQPSTPFGVANEILYETIKIIGNKPEADYHMVTGPTKNILRQNSNNSNTTNTLGPIAKHHFLEHP